MEDYQMLRLNSMAAISNVILRYGFLVILLFVMAPSTTAVRQASGASTEGIGYVVVEPISKKPILPDAKVTDFPSRKAIRVAGVAGEFEPASFVLWNGGERPKKIKVRTTNLKGRSYTIPATNIDVKIVVNWYQSGGAWHGIGRTYPWPGGTRNRHLVPELLVNDDELVRVDHAEKTNSLRLAFADGARHVPISEEGSLRGRIIHSVAEFPVRDSDILKPILLQPNLAKQIWLTLKIPKDSPPGTYKGAVEVLDGKTTTTVPLNLQVYPFNLAQPKIKYSVYYRGVLAPEKASISSEHKSEVQYRAELKNMVEHGIDSPTLYEREDERALRRALAIRRDVGIKEQPLFYVSFSTGTHTDARKLRNLQARVRKVLNIARDYDVTDLYVYGVDEARGKRLESQRLAWHAVREAGAKVFAAGYKGHFEIVGDTLDLLVQAASPSRSEAEKFHRVGHKIFNYAHPQAGPENPEVFRKNYGLLLWQRKFDGAMTYAYQESFGSTWNDFDHHHYRDHNFTYPTVNGVIDTIAWEGFREAVDDVRYVTTLERYVDELSKFDAAATNSSLRNAKRYLENLRKMKSLNDLTSVRRKISKYLLELHDLKTQVQH